MVEIAEAGSSFERHFLNFFSFGLKIKKGSFEISFRQNQKETAPINA